MKNIDLNKNDTIDYNGYIIRIFNGKYEFI